MSYWLWSSGMSPYCGQARCLGQDSWLQPFWGWRSSGGGQDTGKAQVKQHGGRTFQKANWWHRTGTLQEGQRREAQVQLESSLEASRKDASAPAAGPEGREKHTPPSRQGRGVDRSSFLHHHREKTRGNGCGTEWDDLNPLLLLKYNTILQKS